MDIGDNTGITDNQNTGTSQFNGNFSFAEETKMDDSREMLAVKEVARRSHVSQRTVARLAERGQLKALRVGRQCCDLARGGGCKP